MTTQPAIRSSRGDESAGRRAGLLLWLVLIGLVLARAVLAFVPTMGLWGGNLLRFVAPVPGWTLWALSALALVPALGRRGFDALAGFGRALDRSAVLATGLWSAGAATLAWVFPDRVRFVGDFLLRLGTAERALKPAALFPQALPLDVFLHYRLARLLDGAIGMDVNTSARVLGALEAAALGALAVAFARALELRGVRAVAASAIVLCGGYLGMYTGYGKAIAEVMLVTVAAAVFGLHALRDRRALLPLGACVAVGVSLHRSMLGLVPVLVLCWTLAPPGDRKPHALARTRSWIAAALPLIALALMLPRMLGTLSTLDVVHLHPPEVMRQGGMLHAWLAGDRVADLVSIVLLLAPIGFVIPLVLAAPPADDRGRREAMLLLVLALPWLAMLLSVYPLQGVFRDWDVFAPATLAFSLLAAWTVAVVTRVAPTWAWLCVPAALGAAAPSVEWLLHNADLEHSLARVEAYLSEPPTRAMEIQAKTWDFLGIRYAQLGRWDRSADAMARAAALSPSPRVLLEWASAEQARGNDANAREAYQRLVAVAPEEIRGWYGLAVTSWRLRDRETFRSAAREVMRRRPGSPPAQRLERAMAAMADSAGAAGAREP